MQDALLLQLLKSKNEQKVLNAAIIINNIMTTV